MPSLLEQYRIADFLDWHKEKRLALNPEFQRGSVWTPAARSYLIDSILRKLPIPKVYLRTKIDVVTKKTVREVVDGQQRLRAIIDFSEDKFALTKRAGEFVGKKYTTLSADDQEAFLSYPIAVDQLLNASNTDVLEVFSRLNSYSVALNPAEKRHAKYQGEFKWLVRKASKDWAELWEKYSILSTRDRLRMEDDSIVAEMLGFLLDGVGDGAQTDIDTLYKKYDETYMAQDASLVHLYDLLGYIQDQLAPPLADTVLLRAPHFLMLFAAAAATIVGIPAGKINLPSAVTPLADLPTIKDNLLYLASIIDSDTPPAALTEFWQASKANAHRVASRRIRFPIYVQALTGPLAK